MVLIDMILILTKFKKNNFSKLSRKKLLFRLKSKY